jgi:protein-S-isoprenylcysteine O-methyltransferase Ste14
MLEKILSTVAFLAMAASALGLWYRGALLSWSPLVLIPQIGAILLMIWARLTFGRRSFHATAGATAGGLVTNGPYRYIRHPIYTSVCLFVWAGALAHVSIPAVGLASLVLAGGLTRIYLEERSLVRRYPEYRDYAARTARMVPRVY